MEYMLGSLITLVIVIILNRTLNKSIKDVESFKLKISQSYLYRFLAEFNDEREIENPKSQASEYLASRYTKVMIFDDEAYWITDNQLYVATYTEGEVDSSTTRKVDTISMTKVELEKTMFIVEKLTEGNNDSGSSGNKQV